MKTLLPALLVGLVAGAGSAFVTVKAMAPSTDEGTAPHIGAPGDGDVLARLEALERQTRVQAAPGLEGRPDAPTAGAPTDRADLEVLKTSLLEYLQEQMPASVDARLEERGLPADAEIAVKGADPANLEEPSKKQLTMSELAQELKLSAREEDELRAMSNNISDKFMELLLEEGETVEQLKNEFLAAQGNPTEQEGLGMKYGLRLIPKMGEVWKIMGDFRKQGVELLGAERYKKFEGYDVTDLDPLGLGAVFDD